MGLLNRIFKENKKTNKAQVDSDRMNQNGLISKKVSTDLENLIEKERIQQNKLWDNEYYGSEESKIKAEEIKNEKNEYLKNNPEDFLTRGG